MLKSKRIAGIRNCESVNISNGWNPRGFYKPDGSSVTTISKVFSVEPIKLMAMHLWIPIA